MFNPQSFIRQLIYHFILIAWLPVIFLFACSAAYLSSFLDVAHYAFDRLIDNLTSN